MCDTSISEIIVLRTASLMLHNFDGHSFRATKQLMETVHMTMLLTTQWHLPVSHLSPVYPATHVQLYAFVPSTHVAPFRH